MSSINKALLVKNSIKTYEGAPAKRITPEQQLRRSVLSCLLWENEFYEDGQTIANRILEYANKVDPAIVANLAIEARHIHGLRHVPLMLLLNLLYRKDIDKTKLSVRKTIEAVIRRPDELTELLALYWKDKKRPLAKQLQRGLADAFLKFNEYSLAKYNRDGAVKLRDVMFMCHVKPKNKEQEELLKKIADNTLTTPDTWEVELSAGKDKKATFERLIKEGKLGYFALLRNLRNMVQADCDFKLVSDAILARKGAELILPFRYVAAARYAPAYEKFIDQALVASLEDKPSLPGTTAILVDVSGSMDWRLSDKSDMNRIDAACALATLIKSDRVRIFSFSEKVVEVPHRLGMAGVEVITKSQVHSGTRLGNAVQYMNDMVKHDRLIVITDEQSHDRVPDPITDKAYMINVASNRNGVGYGKWLHLDGFSEGIIKYIHAIEEMK